MPEILCRSFCALLRGTYQRSDGKHVPQMSTPRAFTALAGCSAHRRSAWPRRGPSCTGVAQSDWTAPVDAALGERVLHWPPDANGEERRRWRKATWKRP